MKSFHEFALTLGATLVVSGCVHDPGAESPVHYSGRRLFETYCSNCHGADGAGNGPAQPYISARAPDLTQIATRNGGAFPEEKVFHIVDGQSDSPPSDARHMPIWGYELFTGEGDDETAHQQVLDIEHRLVEYVKSIQQRP